MFALFGIILLVAGAIITFAVDKTADGVDLAAIGWIMMAGGGLSLLVALIQAAGYKSLTNTNFRTERHVSSDGQHLVEEVHAD
jgi:hypothetical protein